MQKVSVAVYSGPHPAVEKYCGVLCSVFRRMMIIEEIILYLVFYLLLENVDICIIRFISQIAVSVSGFSSLFVVFKTYQL